MGRSKYPSKLDSSVEIPAVRDNILEAGSEILNSVRSAIFQIERTLGVNPQGASGKTVSDRLNKALDGNGNIKKEALDQANVLSGPISDVDVSKVAGIKESKLKLTYPTKLLQAEISILGNQIDAMIEQIEQINSVLTVHVHPDAKDRHKAKAISVETKTKTESPTSAVALDKTNVQSVLNEIYDSHINYDGSDITKENRSHEALQIYFDDTDVSGLISADNAQDAIEGAINASTLTQIAHQDLYHANGVKRISKMNTADSSSLGPTIAEDKDIVFGKNVGESDPTFEVTFSAVIDEEELIVEPGDILTITDSSSSDSLLNNDYQIFEVTRDLNGDVQSVNVFGTATENSSASVSGTVRKNLRRKTNEAGLLVSARQAADLTSSRVLQVCDPNSVRVTSSGIRPSEITSSLKTLSVMLDDDTYEFDVFDPALSRQSLDSIIVKINEKVAEDKIPLMAYRLDQEVGGSELVIASNYPDEADNTHILKVSAGSDDGITPLGFGSIEDKEVIANYGTPFSIKGKDYNGLVSKLDTTELVFFSGLRTIDIGNGSVNFEELGVREGDLLHITGADESSDNGSFVIESVSSDQLFVDIGQLPTGFAGSSGEDVRFVIYKNTLSLKEITFKEVSGSFSSAVVDLFLDEERDVYGQTAIEYAVTLNGTNALFEIVNYKGELSDSTLTLSVTNATDGVNFSLDGGEEVNCLGKDNYIKICSGIENVELVILVDDADEVSTWISGNSDISTSIFTFSQIDEHSNLKIGRVPYGSYVGKVIGGQEGASRVYSILERGGLGYDDVASSARFKLSERTVDDLRSNGVVKGIDISGVTTEDGFYKFVLSDGVYYVGGKRFEYDGGTYKTDLVAATIDKIFIYIDLDGNIGFEGALTSPACSSPVPDSDVVILYTLEFNSSTVFDYDMRLFINDLDLKVLNAVIVSPQKGMGHFTDLRKALNYTRRFSQIFPKAGTPSIHFKSGTYEITVNHDYESVTSETRLGWLTSWGLSTGTIRTDYYDALYDAGILIDFPVTITGEGDSTIWKIRNKYFYSDGTLVARGALVFIGSAFAATTKPVSAPSTGFSYIRDMKFEQCRIDLLDYNIYDSLGDPQFYGVDIDGCIFDLGGDTDDDITLTFNRTAIIIGEESNVTNEKGNVTISRCKFLRGKIRTGSFIATGVSRMNNINVFGCSMYGEIDDGLTEGDIFSLAALDRPEQHNICFVGNQHFSNQSTLASGNGPDMIDGSSPERWGERFSRDVNIGANAEIKGTMTADVAAKSESFEYKTERTYQQLITFENAVNLDVGPNGSSGAGATIATIVSTSGVWAVVDIPTSDEAYIRIDPPDGATIESIEIGAERGASSSSQFDWSMELHELSLKGLGDASVYSDANVTSVENSGSGTPLSTVTFSSIDYTVDAENKLYWLQISHDQGFTVHIAYIKVLYNFTTLEEILGV